LRYSVQESTVERAAEIAKGWVVGGSERKAAVV
jgi:hypothetical protein